MQVGESPPCSKQKPALGKLRRALHHEILQYFSMPFGSTLVVLLNRIAPAGLPSLRCLSGSGTSTPMPATCTQGRAGTRTPISWHSTWLGAKRTSVRCPCTDTNLGVLLHVLAYHLAGGKREVCQALME